MLAAFSLAVPAGVEAQPSKNGMLANLAKGQWQVRFRNGAASRNICVRNGGELVQIYHQRLNCSRYVVEDGAKQVTVQYSCPSNGYGRTSIRRESASLIQIEGQGIERGRPFEFVAEARHMGACR